ncbi:MAG: hypothetical protein NUW37_07935, partial [Planctomycetes bacterium]|nr:hypothetical protein [Planctomycetota bacterium]
AQIWLRVALDGQFLELDDAITGLPLFPVGYGMNENAFISVQDYYAWGSVNFRVLGKQGAESHTQSPSAASLLNTWTALLNQFFEALNDAGFEFAAKKSVKEVASCGCEKNPDDDDLTTKQTTKPPTPVVPAPVTVRVPNNTGSTAPPSVSIKRTGSTPATFNYTKYFAHHTVNQSIGAITGSNGDLFETVTRRNLYGIQQFRFVESEQDEFIQTVSFGSSVTMQGELLKFGGVSTFSDHEMIGLELALYHTTSGIIGRFKIQDNVYDSIANETTIHLDDEPPELSTLNPALYSFQIEGTSNRSASTHDHYFASMRYGTATGLHYASSRWYDPRTGRFITRDSIFDPSQMGNFY